VRSLAWAVGLTVIGSLGGVLVASGLLLFNDQIRLKVVPWLVSYAVGTLLGVALLVLLPEALSQLPARTVLGALLAGIMLFFLLEKLVLWRHCHTNDCEAHGIPAKP
jgi:zinc and cadmium transporter